MIKPIKKQPSTISQSFFVRIMPVPRPRPSGVIAISAPSSNRPMPTISSAAPPRNSASVPTSIGTSVRLSASTISVMGKTLVNDSLIFSFNLSYIPYSIKSFKIEQCQYTINSRECHDNFVNLRKNAVYPRGGAWYNGKSCGGAYK